MVIIQQNKLLKPFKFIQTRLPRVFDWLNTYPWFTAITTPVEFYHITDDDVWDADLMLATIISKVLVKYEAESRDAFPSVPEDDMQYMIEAFKGYGLEEYNGYDIEEGLRLFAKYFEELFV